MEFCQYRYNASPSLCFFITRASALLVLTSQELQDQILICGKVGIFRFDKIYAYATIFPDRWHVPLLRSYWHIFISKVEPSFRALHLKQFGIKRVCVQKIQVK